MRGIVALLAVMVVAGIARAEPVEVEARILWLRDDHVYLGSRDSTALEQGLRLRFLDGRTLVATAEILRVHDHALGVARLTSGTLAGIKRLDRVRVMSERQHLDVLSSIRIGFPSARRPNLLFRCDRVAAGRRHPPSAYHRQLQGDGAQRLVRVMPVSGEVPWPDTMVVRFFDDVADQEIALERGELDAAVFWPGELSARMRGDARWGMAYGALRGRLVVTLPREGADSAATAALQGFDFAPLNEQLFGGDLEAWESIDRPRPTPASETPLLRFEVDPSCPGQHAIERFLNRDLAPSGSSARVRIAYSADPFEPLQTGARPVFQLRAPLVWRPTIGTHLVRIGADAIVEQLQCETSAPEKGQP